MLLKRVKILNTIKDGTVIRGYRVVDTAGEVKDISREDLNELALLGYVINAEARVENGVTILKGVGCKLRDLPAIRLRDRNKPEQFIITHRWVDKRRTIGYTIQGNKGTCRNIDMNTALKMAKQKLILHVTIQKYSDGEYRLRGKDNFSIEKLPTMSMADTAI